MVRRALLYTILLVLSFSAMAQYDYIKEIKKAPKAGDIVLGIVQTEVDAGSLYDEYEKIEGFFSSSWKYKRTVDEREILTEEQLAIYIMIRAKEVYGNNYHSFNLNNFKATVIESPYKPYYEEKYRNYRKYKYVITATVTVTPEIAKETTLFKATDKALQNIKDGSRMALYQIKVENGGNEEDYKDIIIEILLDKGYKVVAKEYLERLIKEQKEQTNGIYNDETTVGTGNFTAVGYYVNVLITDESVRVHIVNVETGEYEGNATEKLK